MNITTGKRKRAQKVVVYGTEGIGKTTFASHFPSPVFIDTEGSTDHLDVARTANFLCKGICNNAGFLPNFSH